MVLRPFGDDQVGDRVLLPTGVALRLARDGAVKILRRDAPSGSPGRPSS
jgi:hypothetical protein